MSIGVGSGALHRARTEIPSGPGSGPNVGYGESGKCGEKQGVDSETCH